MNPALVPWSLMVVQIAIDDPEAVPNPYTIPHVDNVPPVMSVVLYFTCVEAASQGLGCE